MMKYMRKFIYHFIISLFLCIGLTVKAAFAVENDLHDWTSTYITLPITEKIKFNIEETVRIGENFHHLNQNVLRPALGYQLTKDFSVWQGYAWNPSFYPRHINEQHIWQQALWQHHFPKLTFTSRFRLQERFLEHVDGVSVRTRYYFRFQYPLDKKKIWSLVAQTEPFVTLNTRPRGPKAGLDRINSFFGINKVISENLNVDLGYQLQYVNFISPAQDHLNHTIFAAFYFNLPQVIKKK